MLRKERGQSHLCRISSFHSDAFSSGSFSPAQLWAWSLTSAKPVNGVSGSQSGHWTPLVFISDVNLRLWQLKTLSLGLCIPLKNSQCWFLLLPPWPTLVFCSTWCFSFLYGIWPLGSHGFVFQAGLKWCLVVYCLALFKSQWFKAAVSPREEATQCHGGHCNKKLLFVRPHVMFV